MVKSNDAKNLTDYNITAYTKGFVASGVFNNIMTNNYFQYKEIYNVVHHVGVGVEIICYNGIRKIFL